MNTRLTPAAVADVEATIDWYSQRGPELGEQFLQSFERSLESLQANPRAFAIVHNEIRRALLRRFPFCIFYIIDSKEIVVLACLHGHRDPQSWMNRRDA